MLMSEPRYQRNPMSCEAGAGHSTQSRRCDADDVAERPGHTWDTPAPQGKTFAPGTLPDPLVYVVTPGFVRAMGIRLRGRDFAWSDGPHSERVVLINANLLARRGCRRKNPHA